MADYACSSAMAKLQDLARNFGITPLMVAAAEGDYAEANREIRIRGGDVNGINEAGETALHYACRYRNTKVVKLLLDAGARVDAQAPNGSTPLIEAAMANDFNIMKLLLECGSTSLDSAIRAGSPAKFDTCRYTALHFASRNGNTEAVELLLSAGAHIDVQDRNQETPLILAVRYCKTDIVKQLILHGADVDKRSNNFAFNTALHFAALHNHIECGILLVEAGASVHVKNKAGKSALDLAKSPFKDAVIQAISFQTKKVICVVGNALSGKSTLVASLKNEEANFLGKAWNYLFGVHNISQRTTGIEPVPLNSKRFGSVVFFDFAGQQEYHGPHELFMKSILREDLSTVTVIVVVKATEEEPAIVDQLNRWLYPLSQVMFAASNQIKVLVVASHVDKVKRRANAEKKLDSAYEHIKQAFSGASLQFVDLVCLNCCQPYGSGIEKLCDYFNDVPFPKYKTADAGYSIPWVISRIRSTVGNKVAVSVADLSAWIAENRKDLPTNLPDASHVCRDVSATGHFLYLPNSQDLAKGWLVLDLPYVLHEVYGTIFSPFRPRYIADQFGLVSVARLASLFLTWNSDLICGVLIALEFAIKVDSNLCRELTCLSSVSEEESMEDIHSQHLFFPALVSSQRTNVFKEFPPFTLSWSFQANSQSYISPFLLQSIIYYLTTRQVLFHEQGSLRDKYQCRVWYNGIFWKTPSVDIAVQVSDRSVLQVIATSNTSAEELFKYTTAVIGDISSTIHKLSPGLSGSSYIIYPGEPQTLLENPQAPSPLHMFPVDFMLDSLKKNQTACLSLMDKDGEATRMLISSLFCGFQPLAQAISLLLLTNLPRQLKSEIRSLESEVVDPLQDTPIVKVETTPTSDHVTTPTTDHVTTPTTDHRTTPTTDRRTTPTTDHRTTPSHPCSKSTNPVRSTPIQQLLKKYADKFRSDLNSHAICLHLKAGNIIPGSVCFEVERKYYEEGNLILYQHLRDQGNLEALQQFCKVAIQVGKEGYPKMRELGQNLQRDLEQ